MAEPPPRAVPYDWDTAASPPVDVLNMWTDVGVNIEKNQTVMWRSAVDSLNSALEHLEISEDARSFTEAYAGSIVGILSEQSPVKIGSIERTCVSNSLLLSCEIAAKDIGIQVERGGFCKLIGSILLHVFSKKKTFYKGSKNVYQHSSSSGHPEVRLKCIEKFRSSGGFTNINNYMIARIDTPDQVDGPFPSLEFIQILLWATFDSLGGKEVSQTQEEDALAITKTVMRYLRLQPDDSLKKLPADVLSSTLKALQKIYDRLTSSRRDDMLQFYAFWRDLVLFMIRSPSLPLKLTGWEQVNELIKAVADHRPPPRSFTVSGAGCLFVNGKYEYAGATTPAGYAQPGSDVLYVHSIPDGSPDAEKKLTLFRCTMRSQQKWWFLSEADEDQPGTDRDIDYYQHKSKEHEEALPPPRGWTTCRSGRDPPPRLQQDGLLVPPGEDMNTLEHKLAQWAIENEIVEQVLGDTTIHREVVSRSTALIKFLASMCNRDPEPTEDSAGMAAAPTAAAEEMVVGRQPNQYCLQTSHLLFAWKTCTRKADAAVSQQVYQLLVSVLPLCPSNRSIPLLLAIQRSLQESSDKREYLFEVSEFVSVLAAANLVDTNHKNNPSPAIALSEDVRQEVLNLLWSALTHPYVSALKSYESLKRYVTHELKVEPKGQEHRRRFLESCFTALSANSNGSQPVDEMQALRMVKLTRFILEACPRAQAEALVAENGGALPSLLFAELVALLSRGGLPKDTPSASLEERFRVLRYIYGVSSSTDVALSADMVKTLWNACSGSPVHREILMFFIANASHTSKASTYDALGVVQGTFTPNTPLNDLLRPAFSEEVCHSLFLDLFCSEQIDCTSLGERGYRSFQFLFLALRDSSYSQKSKRTALDALWKIYLTCSNLRVSSQAMRDLLSVYLSMHHSAGKGESAFNVNSSVREQVMQDAEPKGDQMMTDEVDDNFGDRMFQYLDQVKCDLQSGVPTAHRSVERCIRLLQCAIGGVEGESLGAASTLSCLLQMARGDVSLQQVLDALPHGMRGQTCYRRICVVIKRPQPQNTYDSNVSRQSGTSKIPMTVHPLETLSSLKRKVAARYNASTQAVRPVQVNGGVRIASEHGHMNFSLLPENTVMEELGVTEGCEFVFVVTDRVSHHHSASQIDANRNVIAKNLNDVFFGEEKTPAEKLFSTVLGILEALPPPVPQESKETDIHKLIWDLLRTMPTNEGVAKQVKSMKLRSRTDTSVQTDEDAMDIESTTEAWTNLLDSRSTDRSVYVLLTIDAFLRPSLESLTVFPDEKRRLLEDEMTKDAEDFRRDFIEAGGFGAVVEFFSTSRGADKSERARMRQGNAVALRILKSCLFGLGYIGKGMEANDAAWSSNVPDNTGKLLLQSLSNTNGLLNTLVDMVVDDGGVSSGTVTDILSFVQLLFQESRNSKSFVMLPKAEKFFVLLLLWDEVPVGSKISFVTSASQQIRVTTKELILLTPPLADQGLPWLVRAINGIKFNSESSAEFFDVIEKLVTGNHSRSAYPNEADLRNLATTVCKKLVSCPRPGNETDLGDVATGVLCGCLNILRALAETGGSSVIKRGAKILTTELGLSRWSEPGKSTARNVLSIVSFNQQAEDDALVDLMGAIFDGFLSPGGLSVTSVCCDRDSRRRGFDVIGAAARSCLSSAGYMALINRLKALMAAAVHKLRHRWGQFGGQNEHSRNRISKYSGLRNQGCTCYMNSVLQQLFMMPKLRDSICAAPIPSALRSIGTGKSAGTDLVGKRISLQWDNGVSFEAVVETFVPETSMHTIRYCTQMPALSPQQLITVEDMERLPPLMADEFILSEGRPGKETGIFEVVPEPSAMQAEEEETTEDDIKESEDEALSRHLLEEVQRTFIHLEGGSRGHCFDPRALVEACACLKLEFDVWQQNDASEFATKLLDRMEISLKKWAPQHFRNMDHTFGLKQTKQKVCKQCGLKSNREEKLLSLDCQIRDKSNIHEALSAMTEVEIMEGSNKVYCEKCKENTDTILKTAISTFPNMLILSLKRFDLDFTTFETVKLNSKCEFGQTLDMKQYSLAAVEARESAEKSVDGDIMETDDVRVDTEAADPLSSLPDDYQYRLVGVLVHAGVAQGGHYYSFIKDRVSGETEKWYRFDDEDVTPFDPALIETECFGGKVRKETKWGNGQVQTVEQEQFANALMLFYEKVKPSDVPNEEKVAKPNHQVLSGYDAYRPDVLRCNETLQWQSFLFDTELHGFLKSLLSHCCFPKPETRKLDPRREAEESCRGPLLDMLLAFVFDVMVYSADFPATCVDWGRMLEDALARNQDSAFQLVQKLAFKTSLVSGDWLRTMLLDCPEHNIRSTGARIFFSAIAASVNRDDEAKLIIPWVKAWRDQMAAISTRKQNQQLLAIPDSLQGQWSVFEDVSKIATGEVSSIGIILSHLNRLLDALPRCWRFTTEVCLFLRSISKVASERGDKVLRRSMIDAQIPIRIISLLARDRPPSFLKQLCPAACVSTELANTQLRPETSLTNVLPMSTTQGMGNGDFNHHRGPSQTDLLTLLECLAALAGLHTVYHGPIVRDSDDTRGRQWYTLTNEAMQAVKSIFQELTAHNGSNGMGQRDLESYLQRSGLESGAMQPQKCIEIMTKYGVKDPDGKNRLSLEGFTSYHRDCVQSTDVALRHAFHVFGFRPNLTRRSRDARFFKIGDRDTAHSPLESVAIDVSELFQNRRLELGTHVVQVLLNAVQLYVVACDASEPMMAYILAAAVYRRDAEKLIDRTLTDIYVASKEWEGDKQVMNLTKILMVIASTPGSEQQGRIDRIMNSNAKALRTLPLPCGLLHILRQCAVARQNQSHYNDTAFVFRRYISLLKELENVYPVCRWMNEHKNQWNFIERDLIESRAMPTHNSRFDYVGRGQNGVPLEANNTHCSDSDLAEMNDSDDDEGDDDSHYMYGGGHVGQNDAPSEIEVEGAGLDAVNGKYKPDGHFETVAKYMKEGAWRGSRHTFYIFLCNVSNNTQHWYISIVPASTNPGTSSDIDFYTAPRTKESLRVPPKSGWSLAAEGKDPVPTLAFPLHHDHPHEAPRYSPSMDGAPII